MKNMKFILGFSVFGFLLSIFSSFRTVARSMGTRFVIAIGFALVFACLAFAIQFVLSKFVTTESYAPSEEGAPVVQNSGNSHPVDIVIQDEDLPSEENDAQFFVGSNHQMLTRFKRNAFVTTQKLDKLIAAAPNIGLSFHPQIGK